jgi:phosphoserine phosphatase RsbU/P
MLSLNPILLLRRLSAMGPAGLLCLLLVAPCSLKTQTFDATTLHQPTDLGMHWLIKAGDDPEYARTDFDDSHWTNYDPTQTIKGIFPAARPEVVWYRLHVKVSPNQMGLGLAEWNLASAFEIYVNGQKTMQTGQVAPFLPSTFEARLLKRIPDADIATGSLVIALRVHMSQGEWLNSFPGFYPYNVTLGQENALSDHRWLLVIGGNALVWFNQLVGFGLGIVALALFAAERNQREYLWMFLLFLVGALGAPLTIYRLFHNVSAEWEYVRAPMQIAALILLVLFFFAFLHIRLGVWMKAILGVSIVAGLIAMMGTAHGGLPAWATFLTNLPTSVILAGVLPGLLIVHLRRGNREAGILLAPAILNSLGIYISLVLFLMAQIPSLGAKELAIASVLFNYTLGPFTLDIGTISESLYILSLAIIIVLRSTRMSRQQAMLESEMAAAREVQQIMLPEALEQVPGFSIECAYEPAQQVGGDFFQILPAPEGSLLLVIGDVAGKGLPAAMLVSVLVGAIRGVAEYTSDPVELLANLNQRLAGRVDGGFSTALAARIFPDGLVMMANAGHLAPYLDGHEVGVPGALPLGAKMGTRYETVRLQLPRGSRLTFYSDGIVEAQNAERELFGFERGRALSTEPVAAIMKAAKGFGQQDDITVIAITRDAAAARDSALEQQVAIGAAALAN